MMPKITAPQNRIMLTVMSAYPAAHPAAVPVHHRDHLPAPRHSRAAALTMRPVTPRGRDLGPEAAGSMAPALPGGVHAPGEHLIDPCREQVRRGDLDRAQGG